MREINKKRGENEGVRGNTYNAKEKKTKKEIERSKGDIF